MVGEDGRKPAGEWRRWSAEERARLRELAGVLPAAEIARRLGRTKHAVQLQARTLGLSLRVWRP
jgi:hypothetical protein